MKKLFLLCFLFISVATILSPVEVLAQKETFDLITFTVPQGWDKKPSERAIQFSKEDAATGTYCLITLYSSLPGKGNPKENFDLAWSTLVKESVTVSADPEMQAPATEDGWEAQSGYSPFESDGSKGIIILVTSSGFQKMVNIVILTNTDEYEKDITEFLESVSFQKPVAAQTQDAIETQQAETTNGQTNTSVQLADNEPQNNSNTINQTSTAIVTNGFAFNTSNFDDGWTSTVQEQTHMPPTKILNLVQATLTNGILLQAAVLLAT